MATDTAIAPPPPGFVLDAPSTVPPPPEGFTLDQPATAPQRPKRTLADYQRMNPRPMAGRVADFASKMIGDPSGLGIAGWTKAISNPPLTIARPLLPKNLDETAPLINLPTPGPRTNPILGGAADFAKSVVGALSTPETIGQLSMGSTSGMAAKVISIPFLMQMAADAPDAAKEVGTKLGEGDKRGATAAILRYAMDTLPAGGAIRSRFSQPSLLPRTMQAVAEIKPKEAASTPEPQKGENATVRIASSESVPQPEVRTPVGETPPLRQQGEAAGTPPPQETQKGVVVANNATITPPQELGASKKAYHGTPHDVDEFKSQKIGTGEGGGVYGYGLYFAEEREVADQYRPYKDDLVDKFQRGGNLYTVDIDANDEELMDWDKPLSQQSEKVQEAVRPFIEREIKESLARDPKYTTRQSAERYAVDSWSAAKFYDELSHENRKTVQWGKMHPWDAEAADSKVASELLASKGIKGVRYLDQKSREKGQGTSNYVIFNPKHIKITERNGKPVTVEEAQAKQKADSGKLSGGDSASTESGGDGFSQKQTPGALRKEEHDRLQSGWVAQEINRYKELGQERKKTEAGWMTGDEEASAEFARLSKEMEALKNRHGGTQPPEPMVERPSAAEAGALPSKEVPLSPDQVDSSRPDAFQRVPEALLNDPYTLGRMLTKDAAPSGEANRTGTRRITVLEKPGQPGVVAVSTYRDQNTGRAMLAHPEAPAKGERIHRTLPKVLADDWKPVASILLKEPVTNYRRNFRSLQDFEQASGFPAQGTQTQVVPEIGFEQQKPVPIAQPSAQETEGMTPERAGVLHDFFNQHDTLEKAAQAAASDAKRNAIRDAIVAAASDLRNSEPEITAEESLARALKEQYEKARKTTRVQFVESARQEGHPPTAEPHPNREPGVGGQVQPGTLYANPTEDEQGPGLVGMGGATPSQFTERQTAIEEAWDHITKPFRKLVATGRIVVQTRGVKAFMAKLKDIGDNSARVFARQQSNDIRGSIRRAFGKEADRAAAALSFYVEAGGAEGIPLDEVHQNLSNAIDKMRDSTRGSGKWRAKGVEAATFALYHMDQLAPIADQYRQETDAQVARDNARGVDVLTLPRYVPHVQDLENPDLGLFDKRRTGGGEPSGFRKNRTYPTFADSIAAGIDPQSLNSTDLLENRISNGERLANGRAWVDTLRHTVDPKTLKPVFEHIKYEKRADGTTYPVVPPGYSLEQLGPNHVAVHNGYEGTAAALTDPSWWTRHTGGAVLMKANALGKSGRLAIDTYHVGRVAMWQMALKAASLSPELPRPSYRRGQILLDYTAKEIQAMGKDGTIPQKWVAPLIAAKPLHDLMLKSGYNIGRVSDNLHQEWIRATPILGRFNRWVFDQFQRGVMSELWQMEFKRLKAARPDMSDDVAAAQISKDLNARMGNLGRQGWLKSRTAQDTARLLTLAPQWNEGLIQSEFGAYRQAGKFITDTIRGKRLYAGTLLRAVGGMAAMTFLLNQVINFITRGQPTWKNKEKGIGAKLSAWIPDPWGGPGFFLNPLSLPAEITASLIRRKERESSWLDVLNGFIGSKTSYLATPAKVELMRRDTLGRPIQAKDVPAEMAKSLLPTPIGASSFYRVLVKDAQEQYPGEFGSQIAGRFGLRLQTASTPAQDIRTMAREFNAKMGRPEPVEYAPGPYSDLHKALRGGNPAAAKEAYEKLHQSHSTKEIFKEMEAASHRPFTGSETNEQAFLRSLDAAGMVQYHKAIQERREGYLKFLKFYREMKGTGTEH
jgi:hypothetical protein